MKAYIPACVTAALCAILAACTHSGHSAAPVPRPTAYPRMEIPDSEYVCVDAAGTGILVNGNARTGVKPHGDSCVWIDVDYGVFASPKMHLTLTICPPGKTGSVTDNRHERMRLNLGGRRHELTEFYTPSGWICEMTVAKNSPTTPIQILASNNDGRVLSGAMVLHTPDSLAGDPEAVAPIIDAVTRDMTVMMKNLP